MVIDIGHISNCNAKFLALYEQVGLSEGIWWDSLAIHMADCPDLKNDLDKLI